MLKTWLLKIGKRRPDEQLPVNIYELQNKIDYQFNNSNLLIQALKHRSYLSINDEKHHCSNERMEFLGDAVLDLIVTEYLYKIYPQEKEGSLSQKKAILVSRQVLAKIIDKLGLGEYLLINKGEEKTGGRERQSNLANLFESLLGAIYLDSNYEKARVFVDKFLLNRQKELLSGKVYYNYKSSLLEYSQARGWGFPRYKVINESGPDHRKQFVVLAQVNNRVAGKGHGNSKKKAEQVAAKHALHNLKEKDKKKVVQ